MNNTGINALRRAKEILGTQKAVATLVGATQPYITKLLKHGGRVPAEWCLPIERATQGKVTRYELRGDLYPRPERDE